MRDTGRQYSDCPFECPKDAKRFDINRRSLCETCPKKYQRKRTQDQLKEVVEVKLGKRAKDRVDFEEVNDILQRVQGLEGTEAENLTLRSGILLSVFLAERAASKDGQ